MGAFVETGQDFSARGVASDFERIVRIVADGEAHPTFADPWFDIERSQLANSLHSEASISGVMIDRAYDRLLLATDDPTLRQPSSESVADLSREDLVAYTQRYWRPDLTTIAVVGDLSPQRVRARPRIDVRSMAGERSQTGSALEADAARHERPRLHRYGR